MDCGRFGVGLSPQNHNLKSAKTGVTKLAFIYVKWVKAKKQCHIVPWGSMSTEGPTATPVILSKALPLTATPKGVVQKWATNGQVYTH